MTPVLVIKGTWVKTEITSPDYEQKIVGLMAQAWPKILQAKKEKKKEPDAKNYVLCIKFVTPHAAEVFCSVVR